MGLTHLGWRRPNTPSSPRHCLSIYRPVIRKLSLAHFVGADTSTPGGHRIGTARPRMVPASGPPTRHRRPAAAWAYGVADIPSGETAAAWVRLRRTKNEYAATTHPHAAIVAPMS